MFFSLNHLRKLANLNSNISDQQIIDSINLLGFEVEAQIEMPKLEGIKFGKITKIYKNPQADNLNVCHIEFDDRERVIQTNNQQVKENFVVTAFVSGAKKDEFVFSDKELQGINSEGMLASFTEMGFNQNLALDIQDFSQEINDLSIDPIKYLNLNDTILEIKILTNRIDTNNYRIMAQELSAFFKTENNYLKNLDASLKAEDLGIYFKNTLEKQNANLNWFITDNNFNLALEHKLLLLKSQIELKDNWENFANFILIATGQPINLYDLDSLKSKEIKLEYIEKENDLIFNEKNIKANNFYGLTSGEKIISVPGFDVLKEFAVNDKTTKVLVEISQFETKIIRHNLKGLKTSFTKTNQWIRMVSPSLFSLAINELKMFLDLKQISNLNSIEANVIQLEKDFINRIIGFDFFSSNEHQEVFDKLTILGFKIDNEFISVPFYRYDISHNQDIAEEILRFYGYDNLKLEHFNFYQENIVNQENNYHIKLLSQGFSEVQTYLLTDEDKNIFDPFELGDQLKLLTNFSNERSFIRNSLISSLLSICDFHYKRKIERFNFFTIGQVNKDTNSLAFVSSFYDFNKMKEILISIFNLDFTFQYFDAKFNHPNFSSKILLNDQLIGFIGRLNPQVYDYDSIFVELNLDILSKETNDKQQIKFQEYDSTPLKIRDITIELAKKESVDSKLEQLLKIKDLWDCYLIDSFEKDDVVKLTYRVIGKEETINFIEQNFD